MANLTYRAITITERPSARLSQMEFWLHDQNRVEILVARDSPTADYRALARVTPTPDKEAEVRLGAGSHASAAQAITDAVTQFVTKAEQKKARPPRGVPRAERDAEIDDMLTILEDVVANNGVVVVGRARQP